MQPLTSSPATPQTRGDSIACLPRTFKMPHVLLRHRGRAARAIFIVLYQQSGDGGELTLDASQVAKAAGYSRKTVYQVVKLLRRVNLLYPVRRRTGRGRHSLYELNWRKSPPEKNFEEKCHPLSRRNKSKTHIQEYNRENSIASFSLQGRRARAALENPAPQAEAPAPPAKRERPHQKDSPPVADKHAALTEKQDTQHAFRSRKPEERIGAGKDPRSLPPPRRDYQKILWNHKMRAFRRLLEKSRLTPAAQRLCVGVIGRRLKKRSDDYALELYDLLAGFAHLIEPPRGAQTPQDLCRWFMAVINGTMGYN